MSSLLCYNISTDKELVNNMNEYEEKNKTCNDEQFETFIKLLTNGLEYREKKAGT